MPASIEISRHVAASVHSEGLVLFHTAAGRLFAANRTGADIWEALERQMPVKDIALAVSDRYGIPDDTATAHVASFLTALERHGLIERSVGR